MSKPTVQVPSSIPLGRGALLALGALSLGLGACSAEAELPEVLVTQHDVAFEGVPFIPGITDVSHTVTTTFDHPSDLDLPEELNPELRALSTTVYARGDMQDLSFLEELTLILASRVPGAPEPIVLAAYQRSGSGDVGRVLELETDGDSNVLDIWDTDDAYYELSLSGVLPESAWSVDVTFAFSGRLSVD